MVAAEGFALAECDCCPLFVLCKRETSRHVGALLCLGMQGFVVVSSFAGGCGMCQISVKRLSTIAVPLLQSPIRGRGRKRALGGIRLKSAFEGTFFIIYKAQCLWGIRAVAPLPWPLSIDEQDKRLDSGITKALDLPSSVSSCTKQSYVLSDA